MRKDLEEYLVTMQCQLDVAKKAIEKANDEIENGLITKEQAEMLSSWYSLLLANFNRVLYCRHLYNLPPKFIQKLQNKRIKKAAQLAMKKFEEEHADSASVEAENNEAIDNINKIVEGVDNEH